MATINHKKSHEVTVKNLLQQNSQYKTPFIAMASNATNTETKGNDLFSLDSHHSFNDAFTNG